MPDEFPMNDPQKIWQNQPTEPIKISPDEIRRKAQKLQRKARMAALVSIVMGLFLFLWFARTFVRVHDVVPRIGWGLVSLWCIYCAYHGYKQMGRLASEATLYTSFEFYRRELEWQRDFDRHVWRRSGLIVAFAGMALIVMPGLIKALETPRLLLNVVPFFALLAVWLVIFFSMRKRNRRKLQREIDELNTLERENRS